MPQFRTNRVTKCIPDFPRITPGLLFTFFSVNRRNYNLSDNISVTKTVRS